MKNNLLLLAVTLSLYQCQPAFSQTIRQSEIEKNGLVRKTDPAITSKAESSAVAAVNAGLAGKANKTNVFLLFSATAGATNYQSQFYFDATNITYRFNIVIP